MAVVRINRLIRTNFGGSGWCPEAIKRVSPAPSTAKMPILTRKSASRRRIHSIRVGFYRCLLLAKPRLTSRTRSRKPNIMLNCTDALAVALGVWCRAFPMALVGAGQRIWLDLWKWEDPILPRLPRSIIRQKDILSIRGGSRWTNRMPPSGGFGSKSR
jgi:hypothetical protein